MIRQTFFRNIARPIMERLGTMAAAFLIAAGWDADLTAQLVNGLVATTLIAFDLVISAMNRSTDGE